MARGRPRKSDQQKEASAQARAQDIAADALLKIPADPAVRKEQFEHLRRLKSDAQEAAGEISGAKRRMHDVYGIDPSTIQIVEKLKSLKDGRRECVIRQVQFFIKDFGLDSQLSLFDDGAVGSVEGDTGSVFDQTQAGRSHKAERGDDPGRARKSKTEAPPAASSGAIPLDEARKKFEEAKKTDEAKKGTARAAAKAAADAGDKHIRDAAKAKADRYAAEQEKRLGPPAAPAAVVDDDDDDLPPRSPAAAEADGRYSIVS